MRRITLFTSADRVSRAFELLQTRRLICTVSNLHLRVLLACGNHAPPPQCGAVAEPKYFCLV